MIPAMTGGMWRCSGVGGFEAAGAGSGEGLLDADSGAPEENCSTQKTEKKRMANAEKKSRAKKSGARKSKTKKKRG